MADNYLEKKFEDLRSGRPVIRKAGRSLDSLLGDAGSPPAGEDAKYRVDRAQTAAAVASARRLGFEFSSEMPDGDPSRLEVTCRSAYELGAVCTAIRLKLAELHLHAEVDLSPSGDAASLRIFRPAK